MDIIKVAVTMVMLGLASVMDIQSMRVPNLCSTPLIPVGLIWCAFTPGWKNAVVRFIIICACLIPFAIGLIAGGDIKLIMSEIAMIGVVPSLLSILFANLFLIIFYLVSNFKDTKARLLNGSIIMLRNDKEEILKRREGRKVPFSGFLLMGFVASVIVSKLLGVM